MSLCSQEWWKKKSEHVLSKQSSPEDWGQGVSTETGNGGKTVTVTCPSKENRFLESASTVSTKQEVKKLCSKEKFKYCGKKKRLYSCIHESLLRKHAPAEAYLGLVECKRWNPEESWTPVPGPFRAPGNTYGDNEVLVLQGYRMFSWEMTWLHRFLDFYVLFIVKEWI